MKINELLIRPLPRKLITASLAGTLYALLFGMIIPNPFEDHAISIKNYLWRIVEVTPVYLMYSFPVILIYGSITSTLSDVFSQLIIKKKSPKYEFILSALFHLLFGAILYWISLAASILYFIVDRILLKKRLTYKWSQAFKSLAIPFLFFILLMWLIHLVDFAGNWTDYLQ